MIGVMFTFVFVARNDMTLFFLSLHRLNVGIWRMTYCYRSIALTWLLQTGCMLSITVHIVSKPMDTSDNVVLVHYFELKRYVEKNSAMIAWERSTR